MLWAAPLANLKVPEILICDFEKPHGADYSFLSGTKIDTQTHFWQGCIFIVFRVLVFPMFCDYGCPAAPFWVPFRLHCWSPGPLTKTAGSVVMVVNLSDLAAFKRCPLAKPAGDCVLMMLPQSVL